MEDKLIVDLYVARNEQAIEESQKKYNTYLMTVATNILFNREDSEESVNDTYMSAWNMIPPHLPECLKTFLAKLTRSKAIDIYRGKHAAKRGEGGFDLVLEELEEVISDDGAVSDNMEYEELVSEINAFLEKQKAEARKLFVMRYFYMDPLKDCAAYLGMSEAKAKSMLFRMRADLKDRLLKEGYVI